MAARLIAIEEERFRLTIPLADAISFAMDWSDLEYTDPPEMLRHLVGLLAIDALQYSEEWRTAAMLRTCLIERWPHLQW